MGHMTGNQNRDIWHKIIIGGSWVSFRAILRLREASPNFLINTVYTFLKRRITYLRKRTNTFELFSFTGKVTVTTLKPNPLKLLLFFWGGHWLKNVPLWKNPISMTEKCALLQFLKGPHWRIFKVRDLILRFWRVFYTRYDTEITYPLKCDISLT